MQVSMQEPSAVNHIKRQRHPLHSSAGLHRTPAHLWSAVDRPTTTAPPATSSVCCLCSPVTGWSSRWGGFVWPWVVRHTPPLILPSESLQRAMANICELPKCSIRKRRPVGWECVHVGGGVWEVLITEAEAEHAEAVPCVYACLSVTSAWVMWAG